MSICSKAVFVEIFEILCAGEQVVNTTLTHDQLTKLKYYKGEVVGVSILNCALVPGTNFSYVLGRRVDQSGFIRILCTESFCLLMEKGYKKQLAHKSFNSFLLQGTYTNLSKGGTHNTHSSLFI